MPKDPSQPSPPPAPPTRDAGPSPPPGAGRRSGWRAAVRFGIPALLGLLAILIGTTEVVRRLHLQFWQPWTCDPALNLHVFQREPGPFDILFLGPSTLQRGLLPEVLGPALDEAMGRPVRFFSLAQPGPKYRTYRTLVRDLVTGDHIPTLMVVIVGGEIFLETEQTEDYFRYYASLEDLCLHRDYADLGGLLTAEGRHRWSTFGRAALQGAVRGIPTIWQWIGALFVGREFHERCRELERSRGFPEIGWDIRYPESEWRTRMKNHLIWYAMVQHRVDLQGPEAHALEQTLSILEERGIPTLVVQNVTASVTNRVRKRAPYQKILQFYRDLCARHGAEFLNLDLAGREPPLRMFNDPYHMNRDGAAFVSPFWAKRILAPRLRRLEEPS